MRCVRNDRGAFWLEVGRHLADYPDARPGPRLEHMLGAAMAIATGALVFALVRTASWPRARLARVYGGVAVAVALVGFWQAYTGAGLRFDGGSTTRSSRASTPPSATPTRWRRSWRQLPLVLGLAGQRRGRVRAAWVAGAGGRGCAGHDCGTDCRGGGADRRVRPRRADRPCGRRPHRSLAAAASPVPAYGARRGGEIVVAVIGLGSGRHDAATRGTPGSAPTSTPGSTPSTCGGRSRPPKGRLAIWQARRADDRDRPAFGIGVGRIYRSSATTRVTSGSCRRA